MLHLKIMSSFDFKLVYNNSVDFVIKIVLFTNINPDLLDYDIHDLKL